MRLSKVRMMCGQSQPKCRGSLSVPLQSTNATLPLQIGPHSAINRDTTARHVTRQTVGIAMITVRFTDHLKVRLHIRRVPEDYPRLVYQEPEERYYDTEEGRFIAIKRLFYNGKVRPMMIAYEEGDSVAVIVTIHPMTEEKIVNRLIRARWTAR